jgi:alpha-glucosidase (family GH31 glycosyl hydrolase)
MRPIWFNYRNFDDDDYRDRGFMWGDDFLVYPKIVAPAFDYWGSVSSHVYTVDVVLPVQERWYDYSTKMMITEGYLKFLLVLNYLDCCGMYVRAGTIIPIKLHNKASSLLKA